MKRKKFTKQKQVRTVHVEPLEPRLCLAASVGWDGPGQGSASLSYYLGAVPSSLTRPAVQAALQTAMSAWSNVADITFTPTSTPGLRDSIDFSFRTIDGAGRALAQAYFPDDVNPARIAGDVQFDASEPWEIGNSKGNSAFDLVYVAVHEIGHALGLDHRNIAGSVMAGSVAPSQVFRSLGSVDVDAILSLYSAQDGTANTGGATDASEAPTSTPDTTQTRGRQGGRHRRGGLEAGANAVSPETLFTASTRWQNGQNRFDINGDGQVSPMDALRLINQLNVKGSVQLDDADGESAEETAFVDCNGDSQLTPMDALAVINRLNSGESEDEGDASADDTAVDDTDTGTDNPSTDSSTDDTDVIDTGSGNGSVPTDTTGDDSGGTEPTDSGTDSPSDTDTSNECDVNDESCSDPNATDDSDTGSDGGDGGGDGTTDDSTPDESDPDSTDDDSSDDGSDTSDDPTDTTVDPTDDEEPVDPNCGSDEEGAGNSDRHGRHRGQRFAGLDANEDGFLSEGEVPERLWTHLQNADSDGDGLISAEELAAFRPDRHARRNLFERFDEDEDGLLQEDEVPEGIWTRLSDADADDDGAISPEELAAFRPEKTHGPDLFERFDEDEDGLLQEDEVPEGIWTRLTKADTDGDGAISPEELAAFGPVRTHAIDAFFDHFDSNEDGLLMADELPEGLWARISQADTDDDDAISPDELAEFIPSIPERGHPHEGSQGRGRRQGRR